MLALAAAGAHAAGALILWLCVALLCAVVVYVVLIRITGEQLIAGLAALIVFLAVFFGAGW